MIPTSTQTVPLAWLGGVRETSARSIRSAQLLAVAAILASVAFSTVYVWLLCPLDLAPDEAHYWDWSQRLDWSYYSKGPLVAWLIRGSCELFGELSVCLTGDLAAPVRLPAILCHAATMAGWYVLATGIFRSSRLGLAVVALAVTMPMVRIGAVVMTIDPPFLACWCWALVSVWKALATNRTTWWAGAGTFTAFGILAKYTMMLFPLAVVGFLLCHRRGEFRRPGVWVFLAVAMVAWIPIVVWNARHDWVTFRHVFWQVGAGENSTPRFHWIGPLTFFAGQFGMMFGLWLVAFLAAAWRFRPTRETNSGVRLLWWCAVPVWCVFAAASFVKPGQPNWPAPAYIAGFILTAAWLGEMLDGPSRRLVVWCLAVNVILSLAVVAGVHFPARFRPLLTPFVTQPTKQDAAPIRRLDVTARLSGWKTLASEVDKLRARITAETGREPVLAGTYWTTPGQLRFYCAGHPDAYAIGIPNHSDRHSQYDFWRPNPVADAQEFRGRPFVIVGDIGLSLVAAFEHVEQPRQVIHTDNGIPVQTWWVWVCHGFRGFETLGTHNPGY